MTQKEYRLLKVALYNLRIASHMVSYLMFSGGLGIKNYNNIIMARYLFSIFVSEYWNKFLNRKTEDNGQEFIIVENPKDILFMKNTMVIACFRKCDLCMDHDEMSGFIDFARYIGKCISLSEDEDILEKFNTFYTNIEDREPQMTADLIKNNTNNTSPMMYLNKDEWQNHNTLAIVESEAEDENVVKVMDVNFNKFIMILKNQSKCKINNIEVQTESVVHTLFK